jgi:CubicO group peptidase (beta-lactamase class C family)
VLWEEGFGWADRKRRIAATPHTLYSLASISKPITATAVMILKERGLLNLDHPINDYLGKSKLHAWVGHVENATVRRVANHTSGLPLHYQFFYQDEPYISPTMGETIRRYGNLVTAPGERFQYSNLGYGLLSEVIARLSGKSFADFLHEEVFLPLGMLHASVNVQPRLEPFQAQRYGSDGVQYPFYYSDHPGAAEVYCSTHDLMRFGMFHMKQPLPDQKAILSEETLDEMQAPSARQSAHERYGVGWRIYDEVEDHFMIGHSGGMDGVNTLLKMVPSARVVVAILTNTNGNRDLEEQVVADILSVLLPTYAEKCATGREQRQQEQTDEPEADFLPDAHLLGKWIGHVHTYVGDIPLTLWFNKTGDVHAQLGTQLKTLVNKAQFKEQSFEGVMMGDIGTRDANRYPYHLYLDLKQREETFTGAMIAITIRENTPGKRFGMALSH